MTMPRLMLPLLVVNELKCRLSPHTVVHSGRNAVLHYVAVAGCVGLAFKKPATRLSLATCPGELSTDGSASTQPNTEATWGHVLY